MPESPIGPPSGQEPASRGAGVPGDGVPPGRDEQLAGWADDLVDRDEQLAGWADDLVDRDEQLAGWADDLVDRAAPTDAELLGLWPDPLAGPPDGAADWMAGLSAAELEALTGIGACAPDPDLAPAGTAGLAAVSRGPPAASPPGDRSTCGLLARYLRGSWVRRSRLASPACPTTS